MSFLGSTPSSGMKYTSVTAYLPAPVSSVSPSLTTLSPHLDSCSFCVHYASFSTHPFFLFFSFCWTLLLLSLPQSYKQCFYIIFNIHAIMSYWTAISNKRRAVAHLQTEVCTVVDAKAGRMTLGTNIQRFFFWLLLTLLLLGDMETAISKGYLLTFF